MGELEPLESETVSLNARIGELEAANAELAGLQARIGELEAANAELAGLRARIGELEAANAELAGLRARIGELEAANAELAGLQARIGELEGENAEIAGLRVPARIGELEPLESETVSLNARIGELEPLESETVSLNARIGELEAANAELAGLRARIGELEGVEATVAGFSSRFGDLDTAGGELERLRHRIGELEAENAEVSGLRARIADLESQTAEISGLQSRISELASENGQIPGLRLHITQLEGATTQLESLQNRVLELEPLEAEVIDLREAVASIGAVPELDMAAAASIIGSRIKADDLTVVEGIGPAISGLLVDDGIDTWNALAEADVPRLQAVLDVGGARFRVHDPETWPLQAGLLARSRWAEFARLSDHLDGGRYPERAVPTEEGPDLSAGREILDLAVTMDDLKMVEGIGPQIEKLCHGAGVTTWHELSRTSTEGLQSMLADGGPRFRIHDPMTWPMQGYLLATGRWSEFKTLTDALRGGRVVTPHGEETDDSAPPPPDLAEARAVLGMRVKLDDLTIVEGIGPKIEKLCRAEGITTWYGLSQANMATLEDMLDKAGPRFQLHDPGTWPRQADLLARGKWEEFQELTDHLAGGRVV